MRSLTQGRRSGLASVAGVALGNLGNAVGASIGLAAVFAVSALAFTVVKYLGALYLIYLGVQAIRRPRAEAESMAPPPDTAYAIAAGALAPVLIRARGVRTFGRYLTGSAFTGLSVYTVARD